MNRDNPLYRENTLTWNAALSVKAPSLVVLPAPAGARRFTVRGAMQDLARVRPGEKSRPWYEDGMVQFFVTTAKPATLDFVPGARLTLSGRTQQQNLRRYYDNLITKYFPSQAYFSKILDERFALPPTGIIHRVPDEVAASLPAEAARDREDLERHWREYLLLCSEPRTAKERAQGVLNAEYRRLMSRGRIQVKGREATWAEIRAVAGPQVIEEVEALDKLLEMGQRALRAAAKLHLDAFATRAFRRPVTQAESDQLMRLYDAAMRDEKAYSGDAVALAARSVIASPNFLLLREPVRPEDLASRLSYFLWSSLPDAALLEAAASGRLADPAALAAQARRMLRDERSSALADQFLGSWLRFRQIRDHDEPNREKFPQYTAALREAMYQEPLRFTHAILRDDVSILNLLDSDSTFVNEELARHYGMEGVRGAEFRRVPVDRAERGGLLGMGATLTLTSHPARTSPVSRGVFVLSQLLGTPPPPPPPDATNRFEEKISQSANLTAREQVEMHRANPACASCHRRIDPVGFSLENFDAIGRFRARDPASGKAIDTSTVMPDGAAVSSFAELKQALASGREKDKFVRNFCRQLLAYALGRGIDWQDLDLLRRMEKSLAAKEYRISAAVEEIVRSSQFRGAGRAANQLAGLPGGARK
jgi:hypothetical protein